LFAPFRIDDEDENEQETPSEQSIDFIVERSETYILYLCIL